MPEGTVAWFAGVDWGSEKHQARLLDAQGSIVGEQEFTHSGKGLAELEHFHAWWNHRGFRNGADM